MSALGMEEERRAPWPHAPTHQLSEAGSYFVTAATYKKEHHFRGAGRLAVIHRGLLKLAVRFDWHFEAWAAFSNHYHFVAHSPPDSADSLSRMLGILHTETSKWVNKLEGVTGERTVWHSYRDTILTHKTSYLARLNYPHQNAVKHGLVRVANQYPWCSAAWYERTASPAMVKSVYRFKTDNINVGDDDFQPAPDW
jgi:putative transposase